MTIEAINKWLDEEYGCSYTRLEELHDFYFEKYCDLKKENNQLKCNWNKLKEYIRKNIIYDDVGMKILDPSPLEDYMQELERSDSNE
ncbi:MAG: hypothetical protein SOZ53_01255 [Candidatus Onthovivens sp.]|nr:hypothetical protein [Candidatus Onthovivens sp.]